MARTEYIVGPDEAADGWKVVGPGKPPATHMMQVQAIRAAINAAYEEGKKNPDGSQVILQSRTGEIRVEWTYGKDPYPPKS